MRMTRGRRTGVASSLLVSHVLAELPLEVLLALWELCSSILPKSTDVTVTSAVRGWDLGIARRGPWHKQGQCPRSGCVLQCPVSIRTP